MDYSRLEPDEVGIHRAHNQAVADMHFTYDDPATGLKVIKLLLLLTVHAKYLFFDIWLPLLLRF